MTLIEVKDELRVLKSKLQNSENEEEKKVLKSCRTRLYRAMKGVK